MKTSFGLKSQELQQLIAVCAFLFISAISVAPASAQTPDASPAVAAALTTSPTAAPAASDKADAPELAPLQTVDPVPPSAANPPPLNSNQPVDAPERPDFNAYSPDVKRHKTITLYVGMEYRENLPYLPEGAKFKGDFKKIATVSVDRASHILKFQARKVGIATLAIYNSKDQKIYDFTIDAQQNNQAKIAQEMRSLLSDIEGITIKIINDKVVVDGQVLLPRDMNRIISVVNQYGDKLASNLVTLSPHAQRKIAQAIANDINDPEIVVRAVNDKFILEGSVSDQTAKDRAEAIAQMYVPDLIKEAGEKDGTIVKLKRTFVLNLIQIKPAPPKDPGKIIQLVIHFVELDKNFEKSFKFQFTPTLADGSNVTFQSGNTTGGGVISSITGVVSNLLPKLNWAKQYGHARVLQSSSLIVLDGQKGELKNLTRIPYSTVVSTTGQMGTSFENAGMVTNITPHILNPRSDNIQLQMDFSMKSLLGMTSAGPMTSDSSIQTVVVVKSGQSAAVGGLITNSNSTDYNKLPQGNATDPIISLYASKAFQRNQSQFVVFVTPIIKASASQGSEKIKEKFRLRD